MKRIVFAIDQATGASSACGICLYDPNTDKLLATYEFRPQMKKPAWKRIRDIAGQVDAIMAGAIKTHGPLEVRFEGVVMRGRSGQILAWMVGAIIGSVPLFCEVVEVHNITLKRNLTGSSTADKKMIGEALLRRYKNSPETLDALQYLIDTKQEDALDAVAIAICTEVMD